MECLLYAEVYGNCVGGVLNRSGSVCAVCLVASDGILNKAGGRGPQRGGSRTVVLRILGTCRARLTHTHTLSHTLM